MRKARVKAQPSPKSFASIKRAVLQAGLRARDSERAGSSSSQITAYDVPLADLQASADEKLQDLPSWTDGMQALNKLSMKKSANNLLQKAWPGSISTLEAKASDQCRSCG